MQAILSLFLACVCAIIIFFVCAGIDKKTQKERITKEIDWIAYALILAFFFGVISYFTRKIPGLNGVKLTFIFFSLQVLSWVIVLIGEGVAFATKRIIRRIASRKYAIGEDNVN